jgi:hypothetical protein
MRAPQVNAFYVDRISGGVLVEFEYDLDKKRVVDLAQTYLQAIDRTWIVQTFEDWLNHKKHIIDAYPQPQKAEVFKEVWSGYSDMVQNAQSLEKICNRILKGRDKIKFLLPSTENKSFESSNQALEEIFSFCLRKTEKVSA